MQKVLSVICTVEYRQILSVQNSRGKVISSAGWY